tara:strand:- start:7603 stop:9036 length:1434 start_codon:yes stop_codon:yes gene_type:complete
MSTTNQDLAFTPAWKLARMVSQKQVSPIELTNVYLERIDQLDSQLNAYLTLNQEDALASAKKAETAVMKGDALGPLHGLPIGIKDLEKTQGIRTTLGSLIYKDNVPKADSIVVERLRKAGVIILGKTNTSEFGALGVNENKLGDHCRNPWNLERTSGASSGGSGSAIAAGLCALATAGDGGGSIRIPGSFCGLYGIKNSQGRVPSYGGVPGTHLPNFLGQQGPISRSVHDSAMMLQVLAGYDPRDPSSLRETPPNFLAALERGVKGLKLGWSSNYGYIHSDPEVLNATIKASHVFEGLGCSLEESNLSLEATFETWWTIWTAHAHINSGSLLQTNKDDLTWYNQAKLEAGAEVTAEHYAKALGHREQMIAKFNQEFEQFDLLLSPTMPVTAFPVGTFPETIGGHPVHPNPPYGFMPFSHPINTIGHPAATVPCGFSSEGMPIGLHIIGKKGDESTVLAASAAFEEAQPWTQYLPPIS